jgi:HEXXH motif-containing protein
MATTQLTRPYTDAQPDAARARALKNGMDLRLADSLLYLLNRAEATLSSSYPETRDTLSRVRQEVEATGGKLRGTVYAFHTQLAQAMRAGDVAAVNDTIQALAHVKMAPAEPQIVPLGSAQFTEAEAKTFYETVRSDYDSTYSKPFDASPPDHTEIRDMTSAIASVLQKLQAKDPETHGEIEAYVSDFVVIRSNHINAGTCFKAFGLLYLTVLREGQEWTTYLENIVHEAAHHHLFALWTIDRIIESDGDRLYKSPLRTEPRPMSGIFHAMFVLARTIRALNLFQADPLYAAEIERVSTGYNQAKNPATHQDKFLDTYETIRNHARLTPLGSELLESCREMALSPTR